MSKLRPVPVELQKNSDFVNFFERIRQLFTGAVPVANLDQVITNPPTQSEVQDISDKIDELLAAMRSAEQLNT